MEIKKKLCGFLIIIMVSTIIACNGTSTDTTELITTEDTSITTEEITTSGTGVWVDGQVVYSAYDISRFGSATPSGVANYDFESDTAVIWNVDASLDNYGGVQTPALTLDFSKAVYFQMEVVSSFTQYIVKLAVEGESEYYYVLSDDNNTGVISVNIVNAMLSEKYETKNTQPDPGYRDGWVHDGEVKRCSFHILAKGPDGEQQTAELVVKSIAIYNNQPAVDSLNIISSAITDNKIEVLKGANSVNLQAEVNPSPEINQDVIWESSNLEVATVDEAGNVNFIGVGKASIKARSFIDQSKEASIEVNVLSGYEDSEQLKDKLDTLTYGGSTFDSDIFNDLFNTSWDDQMTQLTTTATMTALDSLYLSEYILIENFFDESNLSHVNEANANKSANTAYQSISLTGVTDATIYQSLDGKLSKVEHTSTLDLAYAEYTDEWNQIPTYTLKAIIVANDGTVKKLNIIVLASTLLENYSASDLLDSDKWIIPDRTKLASDPIINALSPASLLAVENGTSLKQNKYVESKYSFGGIVSDVITLDSLNEVVFELDVASLNQMNDYVKTMWDIRIIYYQANGTTVVNSNPLKIQTGYTTGTNLITFIPTYLNFRIYLVVNGSDIGAQFSDATMVINSLKVYQKNQ